MKYQQEPVNEKPKTRLANPENISFNFAAGPKSLNNRDGAWQKRSNEEKSGAVPVAGALVPTAAQVGVHLLV